jgi:hypothetical protein
LANRVFAQSAQKLHVLRSKNFAAQVWHWPINGHVLTKSG